MNNIIFVKIGSKIALRNIQKYSEIWSQVKNDLGDKNLEEILVVGNGPSLNSKDLESLSEIPSIASNKIFLLFENTSWRPDLYTICDNLLAFKLRSKVFHEFQHVLCSHRTFYMLRKARNKVPWRDISFDEFLNTFNKKSWEIDPRYGIFEAFTITIQNIQLAIWLGAKKIYLIGIDHFYKEEQAKSAGKKLSHDGVNHFHPEYRKKGEIVNNAPVEKMNRSYKIMKQFADLHGVEIINISRKTALDVYPHINIDDFIKERFAIN